MYPFMSRCSFFHPPASSFQCLLSARRCAWTRGLTVSSELLPRLTGPWRNYRIGKGCTGAEPADKVRGQRAMHVLGFAGRGLLEAAQPQHCGGKRPWAVHKHGCGCVLVKLFTEPRWIESGSWVLVCAAPAVGAKIKAWKQRKEQLSSWESQNVLQRWR